MNTFGQIFRLTTFGESHGEAIGGIVDGMPSGIAIDTDFIQHELDRRRPGQSGIATQRREADRVELLSGVFEGRSTGAPIAFIVRNEDQRPTDYEPLKDVFRPSHADYTYYYKYGTRDYRGGGRASARTTLSRVVGGALAKLALRPMGISVQAYTMQIGSIALEHGYRHYDLSATETNAVRCPDPEKARLMEQLIADMRAEGDSVGGIVGCVVSGCPAGIGEPEFDKLHASLAKAMMSINAAKGFDYGDGFAMAAMRGSEANDLFTASEGRVRTLTNHSGGIQGGISNGEDIFMRVAFKPTPTIARRQPTVSTDGSPAVVEASGRHDPCVVPRAVPVVEAMAAMTVFDQVLCQGCINYVKMKA